MTNDGTAPGASPARNFLTRLLAVGAGVALLLVVHNYGVNLLPFRSRVIKPAEMQPELPGPSFAYGFDFAGGVPDRLGDMRSRLRMWEEAKPYDRTVALNMVRQVGGTRFAHLEGRVLFSSLDNSDPRTNGRTYRLEWPVLYSPVVGRVSCMVLALCWLGLFFLRPPAPVAVVSAPAVDWSPRGRRLWWSAAVVFAVGLYCNTGTLAPYAVTYVPYIDPATGHAYNQDHGHFKKLFAFVDGQPQATWDQAIFLRRILYPIVTYPAMKLLGFEAGGVTMNLLLNLAAFLGAGWWLRKTVGERGALFAAWLLAFYPGCAYWVGMPYQYAIIAPGSILLMIALVELSQLGSRWRTLAWSLVMGGVYLAYDFAPLFLPATLLMLLWRRRWLDSVTALVASMLPLLAWIGLLKFVFHQPLENSNAAMYRRVLEGWSSVQDWPHWLAQRADLWDTGAAIFFGANFVFLPALFLAAWLASRWIARVRLTDGEMALFVATLALFCAINLGARTGEDNWSMSGSWIARLYQPVFPAMVFFLARWWQARPASGGIARIGLGIGLGAFAAGNLLVIAGPVLRNPLGLSGEIFYRFYSHSYADKTNVYEQMLHTLPRQTFGFGHPRTPPGGR